MGLRLWKKKRLIRRYSEPKAMNGYMVPASHVDMYIMADVQTTDKSVSTGSDGDISLQKIKVFTETELKVADQNGNPGDRIWFQEKWFECRSSKLSENTFLKHWTSTFVECTNADDPPEET
jgi:hypothetical protein